ncbi:hypothetical protein QCA50_010176 [Cerrena zonata]|uniref:DRBM domain-containing protein n=1 Tax=Cerrena zonata TaxID=2478898 RepID=A0AAW0G0M6_9APHY
MAHICPSLEFRLSQCAGGNNSCPKKQSPMFVSVYQAIPYKNPPRDEGKQQETANIYILPFVLLTELSYFRIYSKTLLFLPYDMADPARSGPATQLNNYLQGKYQSTEMLSYVESRTPTGRWRFEAKVYGEKKGEGEGDTRSEAKHAAAAQVLAWFRNNE